MSPTSNSFSWGSRWATEEQKRKIIEIQFPRWWAAYFRPSCTRLFPNSLQKKLQPKCSKQRGAAGERFLRCENIGWCRLSEYPKSWEHLENILRAFWQHRRTSSEHAYVQFVVWQNEIWSLNCERLISWIAIGPKASHQQPKNVLHYQSYYWEIHKSMKRETGVDVLKRIFCSIPSRAGPARVSTSYRPHFNFCFALT